MNPLLNLLISSIAGSSPASSCVALMARQNFLGGRFASCKPAICKHMRSCSSQAPRYCFIWLFFSNGIIEPGHSKSSDWRDPCRVDTSQLSLCHSVGGIAVDIDFDAGRDRCVLRVPGRNDGLSV